MTYHCVNNNTSRTATRSSRCSRPRSIQERLEGALDEAGLSSARYLALEALVNAHESLTLSELAACGCWSRSVDGILVIARLIHARTIRCGTLTRSRCPARAWSGSAGGVFLESAVGPTDPHAEGGPDAQLVR